MHKTTKIKQKTYKYTNLALVGHNVNEVVCPHIIHVWDKDGQEVRVMILGVDVLLHAFVPVFPLT